MPARLRLTLDQRTSDDKNRTILIGRPASGRWAWALAGAISVPPEWLDDLGLKPDESVEFELREVEK